MNSSQPPPVFLEMLRSFVMLGDTQNLSETVVKLGISRQTVRRHVRELEHLKGVALFEPLDRQYRLTRDGKSAMESAKKLIRSSNAWVTRSYGKPLELQSTKFEVDDSSWFYAQRYPLISVWSMAPPILKRGFECWTSAKGTLEHEALEAIRPYMLVYRKYRNEWLIVEVGEKSAYGTWLGIAVAKSELGRKLDLGKEFEAAVSHWRHSYDEVLATGDLRYEHISVCVPREKGGQPVPVNYQRLVCASCFADGQPAVVVFAARTDKLEIPDMPEHRIIKNRPENLMEFDV